MSNTNIYEKMTEKIMMKGSLIIPELFKMTCNQQEADILLAMPGTPEKLSIKVDLPVEEVDKICQNLYFKGVAFKSFKGGSLGYKMCRDMIQFHDASILWPKAPVEFHDLWQEFIEDEWPDFARNAVQFTKEAFTRVIPVGKAIDAGKQQILDFDSANQIIQKAELVAVTKCTCRIIAHKCDRPLEVCLQVNNAARYSLDRGTGREITKKEAFDILRECEAKGLIHVTMNKAHAGHFICNCCSCCCQALPLVISEGLNICNPSRYTAEIDPEKCSFCGTCVERCAFNAIIEQNSQTADDYMEVIADKCMGCGLCHLTCPEEAISLLEVRDISFIPA